MGACVDEGTSIAVVGDASGTTEEPRAFSDVNGSRACERPPRAAAATVYSYGSHDDVRCAMRRRWDRARRQRGTVRTARRTDQSTRIVLAPPSTPYSIASCASTSRRSSPPRKVRGASRRSSSASSGSSWGAASGPEVSDGFSARRATRSGSCLSPARRARSAPAAAGGAWPSGQRISSITCSPLSRCVNGCSACRFASATCSRGTTTSAASSSSTRFRRPRRKSPARALRPRGRRRVRGRPRRARGRSARVAGVPFLSELGRSMCRSGPESGSPSPARAVRSRRSPRYAYCERRDAHLGPLTLP